ncbi:MAG TPA: ComEC/Rec2 family competence protein [Candidatus Saccharimonadales bacterium]
MLRRIFRYRLRRHWLVTGFCVALFAGVFLAQRVVLGDARWLWLCLAPLPFALKKHGALALLLLAGCGLGLGWWRGGIFALRMRGDGELYDKQVILVGQAGDEAVYGKQYQLEFTLQQVQVVQPVRREFTGSLTVSGFGAPAIYRGDTVAVTGKLKQTLGNNVGAVRFAKLTVIRRDSSWLNAFRRQFIAGMQSALPEPAASFGLGLLIGQRSTLPDDVNNQLRRVGLTHVIAVSGYNLTIIVMACRRMLAGRSKYQTLVACLAVMGLFLLATGSSPPIVRASIVSMLSIWAWYYGRSIKPIVLLLVSGAITAVMYPPYLWGNVSWYLSFLSFFGVLVLGPLVTRRLCGGREPKLLLAVIIETVCATVVVLPYSLYIFGQVSVVGLLANVLVVPLIPLAMCLALIAGLGGMCLSMVSGWMAWPATFLLTYILDIAAFLSGLPHAYIENVGVSWRAMVFMYATIATVLFILQQTVYSANDRRKSKIGCYRNDSPKPPP